MTKGPLKPGQAGDLIMNRVNDFPLVRAAAAACGVGGDFPPQQPFHNPHASAEPRPTRMNDDRGLIMKRTYVAGLSSVLALAAFAVFASPASADPTFNRNTNTSHSNANSNSNSNSGANSNQKQAQGQAVTYNETTPANQTINNVPNVYAPGLAAAGSEVCLGSISAGGAGAGFGLTVGGTMVDQGCQLRMNARTLATLGYNVAAREEMCIDPAVRAAMLSAGTPCSADRVAPPQARAEYDGAASQPTNLTIVSAAAPPAPAAGCHRQYQLLGGWYDACPTNKAVAASADETVADAAPDATAAPATGCRKRYQLLGGWYDECK